MPFLLQLPFFSRNWPHPGVLLEKSCAVAGLTCDIWVVQGEGWMGSVLTIYAVHVTVGRRLLTQQFCNAIVPDSRVSFVVDYKSNSLFRFCTFFFLWISIVY